MIVKLPAIHRQLVDGKLIKEIKEIEVQIDTSFKAHLKWEEQFSKTLGCDLTTYTERVMHSLSEPNLNKANLLGMLKLLYCYINSDRLPTFKEFIELFDFEVAEEIIKKISSVLEEVGKSASKN
jgi:hypothetical protein